MRRLGLGLVLLLAPVAVSVTGQPLASSNLPLVVIEAPNPILDEPKTPARMGIVDNGPGRRNAPTDPFNGYDGAVAIEIRGSSSQALFPKKSYAFETRDEAGADRQVSLLGLPEEEDWILYAPYSDKSYLRNVLAYHLSNRIGRYASRTRFVELVLNGSYEGIYVLMEKIKRDPARVPVSNLRPEETAGDAVTGGYILKIDKTDGAEVAGWWSPHPARTGSPDRVFYQYHDPKPSAIVPEQIAYIQASVGRFESRMASASYDHPLIGYSSFLDESAAIDFMLLNEIGKNIDGYRLSTFLYKDRDAVDPRFVLGPIWDFNLAFGNANYYDGAAPTGFQVEYRIRDGDFQPPFWFRKLWDEPAFAERVRGRWAALRRGPFHTDSLTAFVDARTELLREAHARDAARWNHFGRYIWPNPLVWNDFDQEIAYLKDWLVRRVGWMDAQLRPTETFVDAPVPVAGRLRLAPAYPNPTSGTAAVALSVSPPGWLRADLYDGRGVLVRRLFEGMPAGDLFHRLNIDASGLPAGVYLVVVRSTGRSESVPLVVMR